MGHPQPGFNSQYLSKPNSMPLQKQPILNEVGWDLRIGPRKKTHYNEALHPLSWRGFYEYGSGLLGDLQILQKKELKPV